MPNWLGPVGVGPPGPESYDSSKVSYVFYDEVIPAERTVPPSMARGALMVMAMAAALVALREVTGSQGGGEGGGEDDVVDGVCSGGDQECSKGEEPQGKGSKGKKFQCMVEHGVDYPGDGFNGDITVFHQVPSFRE